jgi:hypothetical protein
VIASFQRLYVEQIRLVIQKKAASFQGGRFQKMIVYLSPEKRWIIERSVTEQQNLSNLSLLLNTCQQRLV